MEDIIEYTKASGASAVKWIVALLIVNLVYLVSKYVSIEFSKATKVPILMVGEFDFLAWSFVVAFTIIASVTTVTEVIIPLLDEMNR